MLKLGLFILYLFMVSLLTMMLFAQTLHQLVILLITSFINLFIFFLILKAEFLGISFLIVYIGAIAILFIFTLMVVNVGLVLSKKPKIIVVTAVSILLIHFFITITKNLAYRYTYESLGLQYLTIISNSQDYAAILFNTSDILLFGTLLYTKYKWLFWLSGFLLYTAIIGVITLTVPPTTPPDDK